MEKDKRGTEAAIRQLLLQLKPRPVSYGISNVTQLTRDANFIPGEGSLHPIGRGQMAIHKQKMCIVKIPRNMLSDRPFNLPQTAISFIFPNRERSSTHSIRFLSDTKLHEIDVNGVDEKA